MNNKKKLMVMSTLTLAMFLLVVGTIAYFRRTVNGNITGQAGNLVLIVNEIDTVTEETFTVSLNRSDEEPFIMPDDKGSFDINIDSTGSSTDVAVTINIVRTNLPDNLKFYLDEEYKGELRSKTFKIEKAETMTKQIKVYWFWDGSVDDTNDSLFINAPLSATVSVSATIAKSLYETLAAQDFTLDTNVNFSEVASSTNGQGLMMRSGTENNAYPLLYYRGDVSDNNVIFANKCWLIVRTTETGGIKLVFNGPVVENADGTESCTNYSGVGGQTANSDYLGAYINKTTYSFNTSFDSPVYVGYMYNDVNYEYSSSTLTTDYVNHLADNTVDQATGRHVQNLKDSTVKVVNDDWYEANILGTTSESLLEDAVWCNDRSVTSTTYTIDKYSSYEVFYFSAYTRINENTTATPSLTCSRAVDKFTVGKENGNGDLTYPIGMLTADEILMAGNTFYTGNTVTTYLSIPTYRYWSLSPLSFRYNMIDVFLVYFGELYSSNHYTSAGVRPSISLNNNVIISGGNGSFDDPYLVA